MFRVLDPREVDFQFDDALLFHDAETEKDAFIEPGAARKRYLQRFQEHDDVIRKLCHKLGAQYLPVNADQPLERVLSDFLRERQRRGRKTRRRENR